MKENIVKGHIIIISSSSAFRIAWSPYHMSKWAIRDLHWDWQIQYIVNAIATRSVATEMLGKKQNSYIDNPSSPIGRYAEPSEIANSAKFMVSVIDEMIVSDTFYITETLIESAIICNLQSILRLKNVF